MKTKLSRSLVAFLLALSMGFTSVVNAFAIDPGLIVGIAGIVIQLLSTPSNDVQATQARRDLNKYWVSYDSSDDTLEVSADDMWSAVFELNSNGVPCEIRYLNGLGYYVYGTGFVTNMPNVSTAMWVEAIGNEFTTLNKCLHSLDGEVLFCTTEPSPKLLYQIQQSLTGIYNILNVPFTSYLQNIQYYIDGIEGYIDGVEGSLSRLEGYTDGLESLLTSIDGNVAAITDLVSIRQYLSQYTTNSSGTAFSSVTLPYDVATALCAYLNANFVGKTLNMFNRDDLNVASTQIFNYATISSNYIRINYGSNSMGYLASRRKTLYKVASPNSINVSGDINATLDDTNIVNALNDIEDTLSSLNISASDLMTQFYCVNNTFSDSTSYPSVYIPYESAVSLVALLNAEMQGHNIGRLDRDTDTVVSSFRFNVARMSNGYIVVIPGSSSSGGYYLCSKNHILIRYSEPTYSSVLGNIDSSLSTISDALYSSVPQVESSVRGGVRDVTALVPVADTAMSILDSTSLVLADFTTLIAPEVGILALAGDILDAIVDGSGNSAITQRLDQIKNKIDSTNDKLDDVNENLENILSWLDDSDLADYSSIQLLVQNWSSDVVSSLASGNNILSLFDSAFGDSAFSYQYSDWQSAKDYFTQFWGS